MSNDLTKAIDKLVEEKTFNLEAVKAIYELRTKAVELEEANATARCLTEKLDKTLSDRTSEIAQLKNSLDQMKVREVELIKREVDAAKAIYIAEREVAVAAAYRDAMKIVFAPNSTREKVIASVPAFIPPTAGGSSGYVSSASETRDTTREEGPKES